MVLRRNTILKSFCKRIRRISNRFNAFAFSNSFRSC